MRKIMFTRDCIFEWFTNVDKKTLAYEEIKMTEVIKLIIINKDLSMRFYLRDFIYEKNSIRGICVT